MVRGHCQACAKPLSISSDGPVVMDREGHSYHFACWKRVPIPHSAEPTPDTEAEAAGSD
jgi:hypothetical protein